MTAAAVELVDVTRIYHRPRTSVRTAAAPVVALDRVSLTIAAGSRFGIVGESGSGKTTLLRLLAGLDQPTSGNVRVAGHDLAGRSARRLRELRQDLQMVFQDPYGSLDPRMRVRNLITEPIWDAPSTERAARLRELLDAVGLGPESGDRYPHQFSGGQRQRICIARALAPRPKLLLADEPVSALDVSVRAQVLNLLADVVQANGLTLVLVSHDLSVVRRVCDTVAVLHHGELVELGPVEQIYDAPQHPYTRRLVAAVPTLAGALAGIDAQQLAATAASAGADPTDDPAERRDWEG